MYDHDNDYFDDYDYDELFDNDYTYTDMLIDAYGDDLADECDLCFADTPNGHGFYINNETQRICGDCYALQTA